VIEWYLSKEPETFSSVLLNLYGSYITLLQYYQQPSSASSLCCDCIPLLLNVVLICIKYTQDMEDALRGACNSLIECATAMCAEQLTAFVAKARVFQSRSDSAATSASGTANSGTSSLREQQFAQV
jgi:hypothetical protein